MIVPICRNKWLHFFFAVAFALLAVAIVLLGVYLFPEIIDDQIDKNMRLDNDNEQWDRFKELPFPIIFKVYLFHVKNALDVEQKGAKPILEERGPYVYKQARRKTIDSFNDTEDTVSYYQEEFFTFDHEASGPLSDEDDVTMLNPAAWSVILEKEGGWMQGVVSSCMDNIFPKNEYPSYFITRKVKEFLFDGLEFCKNPRFLCSFICSIAIKKKNIDGVPDNKKYKWLKFSYFNYKNVTPDGLYTVKRGRKDINDLGKIIRWNNSTYTNFWRNDLNDTQCDHVRGTDSTLYPPRVTKNDIFSIYATDICRSVDIYYMGQETYKGINGYMFGTRNTTLYSDNPEENCFCTHKIKNATAQETCYLDGLIDVYTCIGAPVLLSFPHFLWADQKYLDGVDMTPPDIEKHRIFLHVEPNTGVPLQGNKRVQLNAVLRPVDGIANTNNFPRTVLPLLWIDEGFQLPDHYVDELNSLYFDKVALVNGVKYGLIALFVLLAAIFGSLFIRFACCQKEMKV